MEEKQLQAIDAIVEKVMAENRDTLLEPEVYELLSTLGVGTPVFHFVASEEEIQPEILDKFPGEKIVAKVVSPQIFHKTDVGGVAILPKQINLVNQRRQKFAEICQQSQAEFAGTLLCQFIDYQPGVLGKEVLYGIRWSKDFGHVLTLGIGGVETELYAKISKPEYGVYNTLVFDLTQEQLRRTVASTLVYQKISGQTRGGKRLMSDDAFFEPLWKLVQLAKHYSPWGQGRFLLQEMEFNPFIVHGQGLVGLDAIMRFAPMPGIRRQRDSAKINKLLHPQSIAIVGASAKGMNMGRIILNNVLNNGFAREKVYVVKEGTAEIDGCRCVASVADLPEKVDLFIIAVNAAATPGIIQQLLEHNRSESIIIIPGGMGETEDGKQIETRIKEMIMQMPDPPVLVGGNCLGIRSVPGHYDTFFIPPYKLEPGRQLTTATAFISQSGAFIITKMSKLGMDFHYAISTGNQIDLATSDYLHYFLQDPQVPLLAFYIEGFGYLDGLAFARYARQAIEQGKQIILYKAGKTSGGQCAAMGHTASIAGEYQVSKNTLRQLGIYWVESFADFEDSLKLFAAFHNRKVGGRRVALLSNAGFETVGMADNTEQAGGLQVPKLEAKTIAGIAEIYRQGRLTEIANIHNPLDITPVANDMVYEECARILLDAEYIDCAIISVVPLTPTTNTLAASPKHSEDISRQDSLANRFIRLYNSYDKPIVMVVDSGKLYDPLVAMLEQAGIPVFRSSDRAAALLTRYIDYRVTRVQRIGDNSAMSC